MIDLHKSVGGFGQLLFFILNLTVKANEIIFQAAEFALARDQGRFAADSADEQSAVILQEFTLEGHESGMAIFAGGEFKGDIERFDDPGIAQELFGEIGVSRGRFDELIGAAGDAWHVAEIGAVQDLPAVGELRSIPLGGFTRSTQREFVMNH